MISKNKVIRINLLILWLCFSFFLTSAHAVNQSQIQMSVSVVERKSTDTINDFDFSKIQVAGASTQNIQYCSRKLSLFQKLIKFFRK